MATIEPSSKRQRMQSSFAPAVNELHLFKRRWAGWTTIESEPVIWNQLLRDIGAQNTQVQEVYGLDEESFSHVNPSHGIIFCLVFNTDYDKSEQETVCPAGLWFANQVPENACATYALLNIIMNSSISLSPELASFKDYSRDLTPPYKGLAVASFEFLKGAHNSFGRKTEMDESDLGLVKTFNDSKRKARAEGGKKGKKAQEEEEEGDELNEEDLAYHYIAYVHVDGAIWELDGLKRQPVKVHTCAHKDWLASMGPKLQDRIALYPDSVGRFACLALVPERLPTYRAELTSAAALLGAVEATLQSRDPGWRSFIVDDAQDAYSIAPTDSVTDSPEIAEIKALTTAQDLLDRRAKLCIMQADLRRKISDCEKEVAEEATVVERTRHDYEPFIREAARILTRNGRAREIHDPKWRSRKKRGGAKSAGKKGMAKSKGGNRGGKK